MKALRNIITILIILSSIPLFSKEAEGEKIIYVNARGLSFNALQQLSRQIQNPKYLTSKLLEKKSREIIPIENAVTITNLATIETGVTPSQHGIIGHNFGLKKEGFKKGISGFIKPFEAPTFWESAVKKGKQILNIGALITHGKFQEHDNLDLIAQGSQVAPGKIIRLDDIRKQLDVELFNGLKIAITKTEGENYLKIKSHKDQLANINAALSPNKWQEISFGEVSNLRMSAWAKWIHDQEKSNLYIRNVYTNKGKPAHLIKKVDNDIGAATGWPNINGYANNVISEGILEEEIYRETDRVLKLFSNFNNNKTYDLIMLDYPLWDRLGHSFSFNDLSSNRLIKAITQMDDDLATINQFAKENDYKLMIVSGHGFSDTHTAINLNRYIDDLGLNKEKWVVKGFPGKTSAHIYFNTSIEPSNQSELVYKLKKHFSKLTDKKNQIKVVERIYESEELDRIGYKHENAGDLMVLLKPGYVFQAKQYSDAPLYENTIFKGDHGYSSKYEESKGFIIWGNSEINSTIEVAPEILKVLN